MGEFYTKEEKDNGDVDSRSSFYKMTDILLCLYFDGRDQVKKETLAMQEDVGENCREKSLRVGQGGWNPEQRLLTLEGSTDSPSLPCFIQISAQT